MRAEQLGDTQSEPERDGRGHFLAPAIAAPDFHSRNGKRHRINHVLPKDAHILEIGTATGHFARAVARAGHRITALDVSPAMLQYAENRAKAEGLGKNIQRWNSRATLLSGYVNRFPACG